MNAVLTTAQMDQIESTGMTVNLMPMGNMNILAIAIDDGTENVVAVYIQEIGGQWILKHGEHQPAMDEI